jgi:heme-degrading monooxygenase HmoA
MMKRRSYLKATAAAAIGLKLVGAQPTKKPIVLHVDLSVDPAKEAEVLRNFHNTFKPAAMKQPGYIDVRMCKLRSALQGPAPKGANYRFVLTFESEELRQKWVASDTHKKVWPTIENLLSSKDYTVLLYDSV